MVLPTGNRSYKAVFTDKESFSRNDLYERLWTKKMIDDFLVEHDGVEFSNDIGWPRYLYNADRVMKIENSHEFKKNMTLSVKRRNFSKEKIKSLLEQSRILDEYL